MALLWWHCLVRNPHVFINVNAKKRLSVRDVEYVLRHLWSNFSSFAVAHSYLALTLSCLVRPSSRDKWIIFLGGFCGFFLSDVRPPAVTGCLETKTNTDNITREKELFVEGAVHYFGNKVTLNRCYHPQQIRWSGFGLSQLICLTYCRRFLNQYT